MSLLLSAVYAKCPHHLVLYCAKCPYYVVLDMQSVRIMQLYMLSVMIIQCFTPAHLGSCFKGVIWQGKAQNGTNRTITYIGILVCVRENQ